MTAAETTNSPRRSIQLMVWVFAVLAVLGVAALSNGGGAPAMDQAALATSRGH